MPDLKSVLDASPVDDRVRADAWDAFQASTSQEDFKARFDKLPLPQTAKADLWDLKFSQAEPQQPQQVPQPRPGEHAISALPKPGLLGRLKGMVMGDVRSGETMLSRLTAPKPSSPALAALDKAAMPAARTPLVRPEALSPERGPQRAILEFAGGLTSPENAAIIAGMGKLKSIPAVGRALAKVASGGFSMQMLTDALRGDPEWEEAKQAGNVAIMSEVVTRKALAMLAGTAAGAHATTGARPLPSYNRLPNEAFRETARMQGYAQDAQAQGQAFASQLRPQRPMPPVPQPAAPLVQPGLTPVTTHGPRTLTGNLLMTEQAEQVAANAAMDRLEQARAQRVPEPSAPSPVPEERFQRYRERAIEQGQEFAAALRPGEVPPAGPPMPELPKPPIRPQPGRPLTGGLLITEEAQRQAAESAAARLETVKRTEDVPRKGPGKAEVAVPPKPPEPPTPAQPPGRVGTFLREERGEMDVERIRELARRAGEVVPPVVRKEEAGAGGPGLVNQILATHQQTGGSTFNLRTGQNLAGQKFYSVSPFKELEQILDHDPTSQDITDFMSRPGVREKLFDPSGEYSLGTWRDSESGQTYLDVVVTTPKLERAIEIGRQANQIAAFDLSKVDPRTGEVAEGAEIPIQERMLKLYHWSRRPDLETLEPGKYGTGQAGAEMRRKQQAGPEWVDRTYYTDRPEPVERGRFGPGTRSPHQYEAEIAERRIYDLTKDPEGLLTGEGDITTVEKRIRDLGYAGYKGAYPDGTPAYAVFEPLKASLRERLEQAAQGAATRIKERQGAMREDMAKESLLKGEMGASTAELNLVDASIWGAAKLMLKTMDFQKWSKEMLEDFPQLAALRDRKQLEKLYKRSQWVLSNHIERTADGLPSLKKLTKLYQEGKDFKDWYQKSHDEVEVMFGEDSDMFLSMLAATSPMSSVRSNTVLALRAYEQWKTGRPFDGFMEPVRGMLGRLVSGDPNWASSETAPKVYNFNRALHGDPDAFTADRWWGKEFGFGERFHPNVYKFMDYAGTQVAQKLGVPVRDFQAAGWATIKEKLADLDASSDDFSTVLREVIAENSTLAKYVKTNPRVLEEIRAKATAAAEEPPEWVTRPSLMEVGRQRGAVREFVESEAGSFTPGKAVETLDEAANWWDRKFVDDLSDIRRFTGKAELPAELDPYKLAILHAGRGGKVLRRLTRKGGLREIIRPAYKEKLLKDVTDYALLERYEELAGRGIDKFPDGKTLPQIQAEKVAMEVRLGPQKLARVKGYIQQLYNYSDRILQEARDGGLISPKTYARIKAQNEKYVPLQRLAYVADQLDQMHPGSSIFSVAAQNLVKAIHGSEKEVVDPIQGIINNTVKSVGLISRNRVALAMADLEKNPDFAGQVIRLKGGMQAPDGFGTFSVLREGRKEVYAIPKVVADAMKRLNPEQADLMTRMMASSSALLKAGAVTFNMAFIPANALRDFATATLKSEVGFYPWDWVRGLTRAVFKGDVYDRYLESGGAFGGYYEQFGSIPGAVREMTGQFTLRKAVSIANPLEYVKALGTIIEQAPRIGAFERAMRKGKSTEGAGFLSRDVTVNFSKSGSAMRVLNLWVPFLNARQQGMLNVFRAVKDHPGKSAAVLTAMVGAPALLTYLHNTRQHADVWNDIADFEKRNYFIIIYGDERDEEGNPTQVIKIPKGDVGQVFGNPLEHFLTWQDGKEQKSLSRLALEVASDINPVPFERGGKVSGLAIGSGLTPPTVKAALESATNKNWYTGREIVSQKHRLKEASPREQYWTETPAAAVSLGKFLGVSPKHIQNFVGTQFGGLGRQIMEPSKAHATVTKHFLGAKGGGAEEREFEALGEIRREGTDEFVRRTRKTETFFNEMLKLPVEQRRQRFVEAVQGGKLDDRDIEGLADLAEAKALGLTDFERYLKSSPTADRAGYVTKRLWALPAEQRGATLERWLEKGIITDDVADAILEQARGAR